MLDGFGENPLADRIRWLFACLVAAFLAAPSLIVIPMSLSSSDFLEFPPRALSLRWYSHFWDSITWTQAARTSLLAAVLTTLISVPIATLAAYGAMRLSPRLRLVVSSLVVLPAVVPAILIAVGLFFVLARMRLVGSMTGLVLGHVALALPVVFVIMSAAFSQFDFNQEKAARSLGAGSLQTWCYIVLPQITGATAAAGLLAFVTSLDEVVVAMFVTSGENATLPKVMFVALRDKIDPTIAAVSTGLLAIATAAVVAILRKGVARV